MDGFQVLQGASLEVEFLAKRSVCQGLRWVVCVQNWLLELLLDCFLVQAADVKSMEVSSPPKLTLLKLLLEDDFVCEGHNAEICLCWEHSALTIRLEEHISSDYVSLKHPFIEQKGSQWLTHNDINRLQRDLSRCNVLYLALDNLYDILKAICFDQSAGNLSSFTCLTGVDFLCPCLGRKQG